jgi:hypothetical protein
MKNNELQKVIEELLANNLSQLKKDMEKNYEDICGPSLGENLELLRNELYTAIQDDHYLIERVMQYINLYVINQLRMEVIRSKLVK